ncbi:MAG: hypothetical protein WCE53_04880 [Candidatus Acidiferrum sp.]
MALSLRVCTTILLVALSVPGVCRAQSKNKPPDVRPSPIAGEVHGTPVRKTPALTDDDIALLAPRPAANPAEAPKAEAAVEPATKAPAEAPKAEAAAEPATRAPAEAPQDPEKRKAEIAALEQQIKEKQRKIQLLMRMFVLDEEAFLKDPSGQSEEEETRAKRRFEQEELLQEGKEVARLRARLEQIVPPGAEKAPPAKGVAAN